MQAFVGALRNYYNRDAARVFWLKQRLVWVPYERYEYTRLSQIRQEMDMHRTYKKENVLGEDEEAEEGDEFRANDNEQQQGTEGG